MASAPPPLPETHVRGYACFITYRHADNKDEGRRWAEWLHLALETYDVPRDLIGKPNERGEPIPASLYPVFRDEAELSADADFSDNIQRALENSAALIVLCSPRACQSRYVEQEIRYFKEIGKADRILGLIIDGEPNADEASKAASGITSAMECFPQPLRFGVRTPDGKVDWTRRTEPLAADVRPGGRPEQGWTGGNFYRAALDKNESGSGGSTRAAVREYAARLELAKLKLIAGILGIPLGQLTKRDADYRARKFRRLAITFGILGGIALVAGVIALAQRTEAMQQRRAAQINERRAVATLASSDFREGTNRLRRPETSAEAMAFLARAVRLGQHRAAKTRLWTLLQQRQFWVDVPLSGTAPLALAPEETTPDPRFALLSYDKQNLKPEWFSRSADGTTCVTIVNGEVHSGIHHFRAWKMNGTPVTPWLTVSYAGDQWVGSLTSAHLSKGGRLVAVVADVWREPQLLEVWDTTKKAQVGDDLRATGSSPNYQSVDFAQVRFLQQRPENLDEAELLLTASGRGDASVFSVAADRGTVELLGQSNHASAVEAADVDPQAQWLMSASDDRQIMVCDLRKNQPVGYPIPVASGIRTIERAAPDRLRVALSAEGAAEYRLFSPVKIAPPAGATLQRANEAKDYDAELLDEEGPNKIHLPKVGAVVATSPGGDQLLLLAAPAELEAFRIGAERKGVPQWKQTLPAPIVGVRYAEQKDRLVVQTDSFLTGVLDAISGEHLGIAANEKQLFTEGQIPSKPVPSMLARNGEYVLTRSFFWNPPNVAEFWFSVWDLESGLPVLDRIHRAEDGSDDSVATHAELSPDGSLLLLGRPEKPIVTECLQLSAPSTLPTPLADLAEALGGLKLEPNGTFSGVANRAGVLESFLATSDSR